MRRALFLVVALPLAACGGPPPPAPPPAPAAQADEHPVVAAAPHEPVAATPLAPPGGAAPAPAAAPPADVRTASPAPAAAPPHAAAPTPARLAPARATDLVGAWRVIALSAESADSSRAAAVFVDFAADGTVAELVLESGAPPRTAADLARLLGPSARRERWSLTGEVVVVARGGGFPPESWIVERVAAPGALDDARAEAGDVVRALVGRGGRPGARQLLRRLPGAPGA